MKPVSAAKPRLKTEITHKHLLEILHYDPKTGIFTYRKRTHSSRAAGDTAGSLKASGYVIVQILGRMYPAHRLAWFYMKGSWPIYTVDHRDKVKSNNRWKNLRDVPHAYNMQNQTKPHRNNKTGFIGVQLHKASGKHIAVLNKKGLKKKHLGTFESAEAASRAYQTAKALHCEGYLPED